jgi:hypothetical protein
MNIIIKKCSLNSCSTVDKGYLLPLINKRIFKKNNRKGVFKEKEALNNLKVKIIRI